MAAEITDKGLVRDETTLRVKGTFVSHGYHSDYMLTQQRNSCNQCELEQQSIVWTFDLVFVTFSADLGIFSRTHECPERRLR
jgi:hypothetical protein